MNELHNPEKLRDFLLDKLPAAETEALEEQMIVDQEFFASVQEAEDELIDGFVLGVLTPEDTERFLEFCGARPEMPARMAARRAFFAALQESVVERKRARPTLVPLARLAIPFLAFTCAMLAVLGMLWHANHALNRKIAGLHAEKAPQPAVVAPATPAPNQEIHIATLFFPLNATRGSAPQGMLRLHLDSSSVVAFEIATPPEAPGPWVVTIADSRGRRMVQSGIKPLHIASLSFVRIDLDPSALQAGAYSVTLTSEPDARVIQSWTLLVSR